MRRRVVIVDEQRPARVWARPPDHPTCETAGEMVEARAKSSAVAAITVQRCKEDGWSAAAQACVSSPAKTHRICVKVELTPEQQASYKQALADVGCDDDVFCR